MKVIWIII